MRGRPGSLQLGTTPRLVQTRRVLVLFGFAHEKQKNGPSPSVPSRCLSKWGKPGEAKCKEDMQGLVDSLDLAANPRI